MRIAPPAVNHRSVATSLNNVSVNSIDCNDNTETAIWVAYVDLTSVIDSVDRESLWLLLCRLGVPEKIVGLVQALYMDTRSLHAGCHLAYMLDDIQPTCWMSSSLHPAYMLDDIQPTCWMSPSLHAAGQCPRALAVHFPNSVPPHVPVSCNIRSFLY